MHAFPSFPVLKKSLDTIEPVLQAQTLVELSGFALVTQPHDEVVEVASRSLLVVLPAVVLPGVKFSAVKTVEQATQTPALFSMYPESHSHSYMAPD